MNSIVFLAILTINSLANATKSESKVEFACGTQIQGGSFYSDTGSLSCGENGKTDLNASGQQVFCFYQATCTPLTKELKDFAAKETKKKFEKIGDNELNYFLIGNWNKMKETINPPFGPDMLSTAVQCLGQKNSDGSPNCPPVNACVNNKGNKALYWQVKPMKAMDMMNPVKNSEGFRLEQKGSAAPTGRSD